MSQQEIGAVLIALSFTAYLLGKFGTLRSIGVFCGILLVGINGWLISHVSALFAWISGLLGPVVANVFGIAIGTVAAAVVCVLIFLMVHDWLPRNAAKKRTFWVSALVAVLIASAATPFAALNNLPASVRQGVSTTQGG
jgi:hypothetical protein